MDRFARIVVGYHATPREGVEFIDSLLLGKSKISEWKPSKNEYDWLGHGIYFWEHGPERAKQWAGEHGCVIGAVIQLGRCFDLTDIRFTKLLKESFESVRDLYQKEGRKLPENTGSNLKCRKLDCLVLNELMIAMDNEIPGDETVNFQTIRSPFVEGKPAFDGSMLNEETHIQIAVRDTSCILGVFRPNLDDLT